MRTDDFDFDLPRELIAQRPRPRGTSRLMVLDRASGRRRHLGIGDLPDLLDPDDMLLLNDTRVIPARLHARRQSGRRFELLLLRRIEEGLWEALVRPSARARPGELLLMADGGAAKPARPLGGGRWEVAFEPVLDPDRLERVGDPPLPPYIARPGGATAADRVDYQTVYARVPGAVAAPTAGLHLTPGILDAVRRRGVDVVFATLHVGIGTFRPVSVDRVADHAMDAEWYSFGEEEAARVDQALAEGRRVVCVGTTSVRALESALARGAGRVAPGECWTDLFITPGYRFRGVGALLTNFHLPRSTLLMMVSALAGRETILAAYREAVEEGYRFFSYGDAMLIV